ncbi:hypothetical protein FH972_009907 [Carpinus fangiana]|uniref:Uncharacterized protein n=1 Tax=Carpinus fangiana TaxID=176857 RepID=A0A660KLM7_9ROSI|nr:hypothetical protein FH972_009907 [Carpinus fangiana]
MALDAVEGAFVSHEIQQPLPKTADPSIQIAGNFTPVTELPVQHSLPIVGRIPDNMRGVYVQNGANPLHEPVADHHFFDGDDMVDVVHFKDGSASLTWKYTIGIDVYSSIFNVLNTML